MAGAGRIGDSFSCTDVIAAGSGNVFVNGIPMAGVGDAKIGRAHV